MSPDDMSPDDVPDEYVTLRVIEVIHQTRKAILVRFEGDYWPTWMALSQIRRFDRCQHGHVVAMEVRRWMADENRRDLLLPRTSVARKIAEDFRKVGVIVLGFSREGIDASTFGASDSASVAMDVLTQKIKAFIESIRAAKPEPSPNPEPERETPP